MLVEIPRRNSSDGTLEIGVIHVVEEFLNSNFSILLSLLHLAIDIFADSLLDLLDFMLRDQTSSDDLVPESSDWVPTLPDFLDLISTSVDEIYSEFKFARIKMNESSTCNLCLDPTLNVHGICR